MLSAEETVNFMIDILRRVAKSNELINILCDSNEFKDIVQVIQNKSSFYNNAEIMSENEYNSQSLLHTIE